MDSMMDLTPLNVSVFGSEIPSFLAISFSLSNHRGGMMMGPNDMMMDYDGMGMGGMMQHSMMEP
jgi:hypothetical protein